MIDGGALAVGLFLTVVSSVAIVAVFKYMSARDQMRHELILKLLESGHAIDSATLDKLLSSHRPPAAPDQPTGPPDPRDAARNAGFIFFLLGFFTLAFAVTRSAGVSFPIAALGLLPLVLAFGAWAAGEREFRDGTLATFTNGRDPREAHQSAGFVFFLIGYGTIFAGMVRATGLSYPLIGLGLLPILMAFLVWSAGERQYRAGLLGDGASRPPNRA
ncbi:MAG TPA: hypothetical protein VGF24_30710 [Vicinamibacterales bacterium]|jgi:hypothetical protein